MKKIFLAIIASLITFCTVWAQARSTTGSNQPCPNVEMSVEMKAYVDHLLGLDKTQTTNKAPRKVSTSSWSYPASTPATPFGGGTGTEADPYLISTPQQLANLAYMVNNGNTYSGYYFKMTDDIVLNSNVLAEDGSLNSGTFQSWTPIGNSSNYFKGTFDGNGHYVSGVYFNNPSNTGSGLFGYINGSISQLTLKDAYIYGAIMTGGIVGYAETSTIQKCCNYTTVIGYSQYVGGVCGACYNTIITACCNYGRVTGQGNSFKGTTPFYGFSTYGGACIAGICGMPWDDEYASSISYCYNAGLITGSSYVAGISGNGSSSSCSTCCINVGAISGTSICNAISNATYDKDCYYLASACSSSKSGISKTSTEFSDGTVLSLIDPSGTYFMQGANGYPVLKGVGEGADHLYIKDFKTLSNTATTVSVNMANENAISSFQFDLVLPSDVTLNSVTGSSARTSYTYNITQKTLADGSIRIVCIATGSAAAKFTGNDGEVLLMSFTSTSTGDKTITLKNQILTESDLDEVTGVESTASMHVHNVTAHSATAATCTATGNTDYWYCSVCGKYFTNSACTSETTLADVTIAALGHNLSSVDNGNGTHTNSCSRCDYSSTEKHTFVGGVCSVCGSEKIDDTDVSQYDNIVYVNNITAAKGTTANLSIQLNNTDDVIGYDLDLYLPNGVTVGTYTDSFGDSYIDASLTEDRTNSVRHTFKVTQNEGYLKVLCYSEDKKTFVGNSGEVAKIKINIPNDMGEGEYPIFIKNEAISLASTTPRIETIKATLEVVKCKSGDANGDSYINVGDITAVAGYILGENPEDFVDYAADVNADGYINVGDITTIAGIILDGSAEESKLRTTSANLYGKFSIPAVNINAGDEIVVPVCLDNEGSFSSYQFDINVPAGFCVKDIVSNSNRSNQMDFCSYAMISNDVYRVLAYSISDTPVVGTEGAIAYVTLSADKNMECGEYDITLCNGVLACRKCTYRTSDVKSSISVGNTTGICAVCGTNADVNTYDLNGRILRSNQYSSHGVYIINNKKVIK